MKKLVISTGILLATAFGPAFADMYIYPSRGQSEKQQEKDKWECHEWAVKQTGVDPTRVAQEATAAETYTNREAHPHLLGGAGRGAALGAVGGAIAGDAGKGAAIGAAAGGMASVLRARREAELQHQYNRNLADHHSDQLQQYDRAFATCLQGRGYTVN